VKAKEVSLFCTTSLNSLVEIFPCAGSVVNPLPPCMVNPITPTIPLSFIVFYYKRGDQC